MKYFKNTELAKLYHVSEKSVRNWIDAAGNGKLDLQLHDERGRLYIANTPRNNLSISELVEKGKKYKNSRGLKTINPSPEFYKLCTQKQIFDLITNLDIYREIPHQYSYLDGGAKHWDQYAQKLLDENTSNSVKNTIQLVDLNENYISALVEGFDGVNIIDIGLGNCLPVRQLLEHLLRSGKLRRYIGLDISQDMLNIAGKNIKDWFGGKVNFEGYVRDINYDRFDDLLVADSFGREERVVNLVLFFGGTISNFRDPNQSLSTIKNSMGKNDIFILSRKPDTEASRRFFDFTVESEDKTLSIKEKNIPDLLGINDSFYEVEQSFDHEKMARVMQIRLKLDLSIIFKLENNRQRIVELRKGERILLWRSDHQTPKETIERLDGNGLEVLQATQSTDQQYLMVISKLKTVR